MAFCAGWGRILKAHNPARPLAALHNSLGDKRGFHETRRRYRHGHRILDWE